MTSARSGHEGSGQAARDELPAEEKELTRRNDELARKRRELPWVPVETDYGFDTAAGTKSLAELFDGHSQRRMGWNLDWASTVAASSTARSASCTPRRS